MAVKASVNTQNQTTVRVGQQNAIRVGSTAAGIRSADTATTAVNVVGGRADVTQLAVSGLSTFTGIVTTASDLYVGGDLYLTDDLVLDNISGNSLDISGISSVGFLTATDIHVSGAVTATKFYGDGSNLSNVAISGADATFSNLKVTGITTISTLKIGTGITASGGIITATSFYGDGSNLTNTGPVLSDASGSQRLIVSSLNSGIMTTAATDSDLTWDSTTNTLSVTNVSIAGTLTYEDVINVDSVGIVTAGKGLRVTEGGLVVSAGFSTVGFLTANNVWVSGAVTATSYYGDGTNLTGVVTSGDAPPLDAGYWVKNDVGIHTLVNVGIGTTNPDAVVGASNTSVLAVGIVTANTFYGNLTGNADTAGIATVADGLQNNPDIDVKSIVGTALSISGGISTLGVTSATDLESQNLNVTGITTVGFATATDVWVSGAVTATSFYGTINSANILRYSAGFTASAGVPVGIDTFPKDSYDSAEYVLYFKLGTDIQSQKLLVMDNGSVAYSNEYAVMYHEKQLVDLSCTVSSSNIIVSATPVTGISGALTYVWQRSTLTL